MTTDSPQLRDQTAIINGVTVELEFYHEQGEVVSSLWLSITTEDGRFAGSMALCEHMGGIPYDPGSGPDDGPEVFPLPQSQLNAIAQWAAARGY